ncbi:protein-disulfide reductase DsbD [Oceanobacter sp. 4_MG-2023]|uniref:protein-disulfide reductase DsbD n=1 Tax=Oceanobacter sp. 4_MG-2023 TaxID=3062623 RepID=UPI0027347FAE|nr:protein-disulfide reductase DsbD [Oceanobacter sp. 4_MG-2023]MDP2549226.1 protein-disulfide reductase DsbD [Oceanobacter sp. 4_MG-2023]
MQVVARYLIAILALLALTPTVQAGLFDPLGGAEPKFLPVEQAFPLQTDIDGGLLIAQWQTPPGYYLYQHRIYLSQDDIQQDPASFSEPGIDKYDEAFGDIIAHYGPREVIFKLDSFSAGVVTLHYQGCADAGLCYPPQRINITIAASDLPSASPVPAAATPSAPWENTATDTATTAAGTTANAVTQSATTSASSGINSNNTYPPATGQPASSSAHWFEGSWLTTIGLFFLLGIGLTFTPCVLPMIPIMSAVVMGQNQTISARRGFLLSSTYVLGMAITYALAGVIMGLLGAGANIQAWMQTPWVLVLFALLFVLLALSMFGLYELQLPSKLRNRLNQMSQQQSGGHLLSVFVIGILSALIVSPCVSAPLAGALVYLSTTGNVWLGGGALLALGLGMGAPLIILGTSGGSLMPKAGAWMNQIKIFFGVLLLAVALWLVSRILPGSLSLALWGLLALVYAVVAGVFEPASTPRHRAFKGLAWALLVYGVAAFWGALQGNHNPLQPLASTHAGSAASAEQQANAFYRTESVTDIQRLIKNSQQPVMLDLYADWCISCKVMDEEIFADDEVQRQLSHMTWLQLDITRNTDEQIALLQSLAVFGPPTVLFFHEGIEVPERRIVGEISKAEFLRLTQP